MNATSPSSEGRPGFLDASGLRLKIHPADAPGRFLRWRRIVYALLILHYLALPFIKNGQHPAIHLDIEARRFYLAGQAFNAQDVWLLVFLLGAFAFGLVFVTSLAGRVWCGWACPQTVFLEGVYRRIERLIEGPATQRQRLDAGPWSWDRVWRKLLKQSLFVAVSLVLAHWALAFFVPAPQLAGIVLHGPAGHATLFGWAMGLTGLIWFNFAWFREQFCVILCPYGRLQSVLIDRQSVIIGYDGKRGEPRGKALKVLPAGVTPPGDCIDCGRCVRVCPTGIDIRKGLQLECIGCAQCIDACDEVMDKVERPRGLIRYDSLVGFEGGQKRIVRPRLFAYAAMSVLALGAVVLDVSTVRAPFEANLLRAGGTPYALDGGLIRDQFELHLVNKHVEAADFQLSVQAPAGTSVVLPQPEVHLGSLESLRTPILVAVERKTWGGPFDVEVHLRDRATGQERVVTGRFIGPPVVR
ncbi:MAG: cytochrome c oxidase accessory protein CcoG [Deltaproteobacteria bacterium]|nr:cytochrome c oxidase accessory protein CcoG [Deltaproteobacteria bacterium]